MVGKLEGFSQMAVEISLIPFQHEEGDGPCEFKPSLPKILSLAFRTEEVTWISRDLAILIIIG